MNSLPIDRMKHLMANPGGLLRSRRAMIVAGGLLAAAALAAGWPELVAVGVAPLILSVAPCLVMCALGLCVMRSCNHKTEATSPATTPAAEIPQPSPHAPTARLVPRDSLS